MLISIITVCFNSEKTIRQTIESVLSQTYEQIEHIIIDGQSNDETGKIVQAYVQQYPDRFRFVCEPDSGIYNAMNKGVELATGELIGIINSDDWYEQRAVETVVKAYREGGDAVYHGIQRTYSDSALIGLQGTSASQLSKQMIEHPTCFVPRRFYRDYGLFDESYRYVADYEFMLRLQQKGVAFVMIEQVLANFRQGGASHKPEAVWENYRLWLKLGLLSKQQYAYRLVMDRVKLYLRRRKR